MAQGRREPGLVQHCDEGHCIFREVPGKAGNFGLLRAKCGETSVPRGHWRDGGLAVYIPAVPLASWGLRPSGACRSFQGVGATPRHVSILLLAKQGRAESSSCTGLSSGSFGSGWPLCRSHSRCRSRSAPGLALSPWASCLAFLFAHLLPHLNPSHM